MHNPHSIKHSIHLVGLFLVLMGSMAKGKAVEVETTKAIEFASINGHALHLDLYRPDTQEPPKTLVWVHGGAWRAGSRASMPLNEFVKQGYAIASVDYRLTPVARFPAQVHDIKAAIRFLRAHSQALEIDTREIVIAGASAGGHLAALVGTTNGHPELEGTVGEHLNHSSDVQKIISYYGASNLTSILNQSTPHGLGVRIPALQLLLGGQPDKKQKLAKLASPVFHIDPQDPPLFLVHGDQDPQMPINQAHELKGAYDRIKLPNAFVVLHGSAHGGSTFYSPELSSQIIQFLRSND